VTDEGLCALDFIDSDDAQKARNDRPRGHRLPDPPPAGPPQGARARHIAERVRAYFAGELGALDEIAVAPSGTPFQLQVWAALRRIPVGQTRSYQELAVAVAAPTAARAVGAANGRNPISLIVPCHRVIAANGTLHGYGGGLWRKDWLLRHEGALPRERQLGLAPRGSATLVSP
jgi:methylated-DNA-[protein]-cysteine S-methyltransferase